jgi:hypothetical protein
MKKFASIFFLTIAGVLFSGNLFAGGPPPPPPPPLGIPVDAGALIILVIGSAVGVVTLSKRMKQNTVNNK